MRTEFAMHWKNCTGPQGVHMPQDPNFCAGGIQKTPSYIAMLYEQVWSRPCLPTGLRVHMSEPKNSVMALLPQIWQMQCTD